MVRTLFFFVLINSIDQGYCSGHFRSIFRFIYQFQNEFDLMSRTTKTKTYRTSLIILQQHNRLRMQLVDRVVLRGLYSNKVSKYFISNTHRFIVCNLLFTSRRPRGIEGFSLYLIKLHFLIQVRIYFQIQLGITSECIEFINILQNQNWNI